MTNQPMNIEELIENVRAWGIARNITGPTGKGTLLAQLSKTQEELTETRDAAVLLLHADTDEEYNRSINELADGYGDQVVTIILGCEMAGLRFEHCLAAAYDEIKGRTGTMQGGVFVKDKP